MNDNNILGGRFFRIPMLVGQINVSWKRRALFSERYHKVPTIKIGSLRLTWRQYH